MKRSSWLKIRASKEELSAWKEKAAAAGMPLSQLLRLSLTALTVHNRADDRELIRALSRLGANMNQLAAWANTRRDRLEGLRLVPYLIDLERQVRELVATRRDRP